ncbi:MAG: ABC transporter ATP-binding protein [Desulfobacterales bacterium]|nr:ABC transporter ATP-binding protein [Desulfobacterales bacterium]
MTDLKTCSTGPMIELSEVIFSWNFDTVVLNLDRLRIFPGERVFIAGPSGSGKTTLLNLIAGIIIPQKGTVSVSGEILNRFTGTQRDLFRADHIGFIFQMFNLVPYLSVVENVALSCSFSKTRRNRAISRSGSIESEADRLLKNLGMDGTLDTGQPVTRLSVGQQQRVAAARALIGEPDIIIADEPTSALDMDRRKTFLELLFKECKRKQGTIVFVSHDTSLETMFDRTIELNAINRIDR